MTDHARTNMQVIEKFLPVKFTIEPKEEGVVIALST
jgi:RNA 3'-terminal phosphate cyclase